MRQATQERAIDYPVARRQRLRGLERLRQPLLAGALLRRRGRHHPRPALRRRALRAIGARRSSACSASSASSSPSRGTAWRRRPTGTTCARPRPISATRAASSPRRDRAGDLRSQPLGARRRVDGRVRERRARRGRREHRLPVPRARRAPRAVARSARADPLPRARSTASLRARRTAWTSTRRATACSATAACTSSCASTDAVRERTLEITFLEPGAEAYAFTFG